MNAVRKAVITAAGRGTRQYPATSIVQKVMLPLVDRDGITKPTIQIIAEEALDAGIEEICIVVSPGDERQFRDYFKAMEEDLLPAFAGKEWALKESEKLGRMEESLTFAVQERPEGYGHAVYQAKRFVGDEPFLLLLGDHIYVTRDKQGCARQLLEAFCQIQPEALTAVRPTSADRIHMFGVIRGIPLDRSGRVYRVASIKEKPSINYASDNLVTAGLANGVFLCHFGMHIFPPLIFDCLEQRIRDGLRENGEFQLTSAQDDLRQRLSQYYSFIVHGERYDTGIPFGLMEAQIALALRGVHRQELARSIFRVLENEFEL
jgi:UTP--glucose-1-phosphate uridylyltransferase